MLSVLNDRFFFFFTFLLLSISVANAATCTLPTSNGNSATTGTVTITKLSSAYSGSGGVALSGASSCASYNYYKATISGVSGTTFHWKSCASCSSGQQRVEKAASDIGCTYTYYVCETATLTCSAGNYLKANSTSCAKCEANYYCPGGTYTYGSSIQGRSSCSTDTSAQYPYSSAGSAGISSCYTTCSAYDSGGYRYTPMAANAYYGNPCLYDRSCITDCTSVANTGTSSGAESCTRSCSISNGSCYYSGSTRSYTDTCVSNFTGGGCYSAGATCSGCNNWVRTSTGDCTGGTRYISCQAGTYWNGSGCASCGDGYYCPGFSNIVETSLSNGYGRNSCTNRPDNSVYVGSSTTNSCPWSCNAGYYGSSANGNTYCADCGSGNYCTGGTHRESCSTTVKSGAPTPSSITSLSSGSWSDYEHGASAADCICNWVFSDDTTTSYLQQTQCYNGPAGSKYRYYSQCRLGHYASDPLYWGDWYTSCTACTNKPANSYYTSYSTPSTMYAVESNCPWDCEANFYKDGNSCLPCPSSHPYSSAGSVGSGSCYTTCSAYDSGGYHYTPNATVVYYNTSCSYTSSCITNCTSVANTGTSSGAESCTYDCTASIANAASATCSGTRSYTNTCSGYFTGGGCYSASATCTGCSNWVRTSTGDCSGGTVVSLSCESGYALNDAGNKCISTKAITCAPGTYLAANKTTCSVCKAAYYCPGGTYYTDSSDQGAYACPNSYTYNTSTRKRHYTECRNLNSAALARRVISPGVTGGLVPGGWYAQSPSNTTAYVETGYGQMTAVFYCPDQFQYQSSNAVTNHRYPGSACLGTVYAGGTGRQTMLTEYIQIFNTGPDIFYIMGFYGVDTEGEAHFFEPVDGDGAGGNPYVFDSINNMTESNLLTKYGIDLYDMAPSEYAFRITPGGGVVLRARGSGPVELAYIVIALKNELPILPTPPAGIAGSVDEIGIKINALDAESDEMIPVFDNLNRTYNDRSGYIARYASTVFAVNLMHASLCEPGTYAPSERNVNYDTIIEATCDVADVGYYVRYWGETSQTQCTATDGWTTTTAGTGSTSYKNCYQTQTPENCASGTVKRTGSSISGTTITYGNTTVISALSANANHYVDGTSCSACSGLASGFYPNSDAGNSSGSSACYTNSLSGGYVKTAGDSSATSCESGQFKGAHTVNYGFTSVPDTCPTGYAGSDGTRTVNTDCYASCDAKTISGGTTTAVNAKEYYTGSAYPACTYNVNCNPKYGASGDKTSNPACALCDSTEYSTGGTSVCAACETVLPENASYVGGPFASSACVWECDSGYNQTSANQCAQMCIAGFQHLKSSTGVSVPLYTTAQTTHSIVVKSQSGVMCYASLADGAGDNAINVNLGGTTYHTIK